MFTIDSGEPVAAATLLWIQLLAIERWAAGNYGARDIRRWQMLALKAAFRAKRKGESTLVARVERRRVVGFGRIESRGRLLALYVHPEFAGRGIGSALLGSCEQLVLDAGSEWTWLDAALNAVPFYFKHRYALLRGGAACDARSSALPTARMAKELHRG